MLNQLEEKIKQLENEIEAKKQALEDESNAKIALFHKTTTLQKKLLVYESNGKDTINSASDSVSASVMINPTSVIGNEYI